MYLTYDYKERIIKSVTQLLGIYVNVVEEPSNYNSGVTISIHAIDADKCIEECTLATFSLSELPGCCGVVVSHGTWIIAGYRNKGLGTLLADIKIEIAKYWGYTIMLCTDIAGNTPQRKILDSNNWKTIGSFINKRTGNDINIDVKHLYSGEITKVINA